MNSMGSSTVMMCPFSSLLILSIRAASVVLLPDPVGPVPPQLGTLARHDVQVRRVPLDHLFEQGAEIHRLRGACGHAAVSFTTSSRVVMPRFTFSMPSIRSVSMPSFTACSRSSSVDPPFRTIRRTALVMAMTSYSPCRPLYPEPLQVSQPAPL